jgi:hypothetical protein
MIMITAALCLLSCSKQILKTTNIDGNYTGVLEVTSTDPAANTVPLQGKVSAVFKGNDYTCATNMTTAYASGAGKFFVKKDVMTFTDTLMHPANFDWNLILNGSYTYDIAGDNITLVKKLGTATYTYHLKKQ